ncbi:hypothetical protein [Pseudoalteromonas nigrifaciens]|uniref:hypothetical protein n=1 Tax=Pseudoalteromonas nigrifaciens TaxID=28109 RepID=UPI003FD480F0
MTTVKFKQDDPRFSIFADEYTFLVCTDPQHIDTSSPVSIGPLSITTETVFSSLGKNILKDGFRYLEAQAGNYYRFVGCIKEVDAPGFIGPVNLVLFSAFSVDGTNEQLSTFAQQHNARNAYFALAYTKDEEQFEFINSEYAKQCYTLDINVVHDDGNFLLVDEL